MRATATAVRLGAVGRARGEAWPWGGGAGILNIDKDKSLIYKEKEVREIHTNKDLAAVGLAAVGGARGEAWPWGGVAGILSVDKDKSLNYDEKLN